MRRRQHHWHNHPGVRSHPSELTLGERAADALRNGMGSWVFVFASLAFLAGWMTANVAGPHRWDAYPFILLNLVLSCLAALQGAILLIAAKRSDQVAAEQATHHYQETRQLQQLLATNTELTEAVATLVGHTPAAAADTSEPS